MSPPRLAEGCAPSAERAPSHSRSFLWFARRASRFGEPTSSSPSRRNLTLTGSRGDLLSFPPLRKASTAWMAPRSPPLSSC